VRSKERDAMTPQPPRQIRITRSTDGGATLPPDVGLVVQIGPGLTKEQALAMLHAATGEVWRAWEQLGDGHTDRSWYPIGTLPADFLPYYQGA
jgi:hypothetical protein